MPSPRTFLLAALAAAVPGLAIAGEPPEWRLLRWGELKVGKACVTRSREQRGGQALVRTDVDREYSYFQGKDVRLVSRETVLEREDGSVAEFSYASQGEAGKTIVLGTVAGGKLKYLVQTPGEAPKETESDWPADAVGPARVEKKLKDAGLSKGARAECTTYSFSSFALCRVTFAVEGPETLRVGGRERALRRVAVQEGDGAAGRKTRWVADDGSFVREVDAWCRTEEACSDAEAQAPGKGVVAQYPTWSNAAVSGPVIRPRAVSGASFLVTGHEVLAEWPFAGPGQAGSRQAGGAVVTVRVPPRPASPARLPVASKEMEPFLQANYFLDCDAEEVKALGARIVGAEKDAGKAAEAIRLWAFKNLAKNTLNTGMAAASAALALGEGDPVEHAVVVAALCRAAGVPSRIAGGLLVTGSYAVCHAWAEAWTGAWVPLDATQEQAADAMRVRFAESDLNGPSPEAVLLGLAGMGTNLRLEVQAYQLGGVLVDPRDPNKGAHRTDGDAYFHALYGFGFAKPATFRWMTDLQGLDNAVIGTCGKGGNQERILVRAGPAGGYTLDAALAAMERSFDVQVLSRPQVAGFPAVIAKTGLKGRPGFAPLVCMILAGDTILTFESSDTTAEVKAAFELALKTLHFKG
jgi:hypothetical protein